MEGENGRQKEEKSESGRNGDGKRRVRIGLEPRKTTFGGMSKIRETTIDEKSQTKHKDESKSRIRLSNCAENHKQFQ